MRSEAEVTVLVQKFIAALRAHAAMLDVRIPDIRLKYNCEIAEESYLQNQRFVAHAFHHGNTICIVARGIGRLTPHKICGVIAHEVGHIMSDVKDDAAEGAADQWMRENLGIEIYYDSMDSLEFLDEKTLMSLGVTL